MTCPTVPDMPRATLMPLGGRRSGWSRPCWMAWGPTFTLPIGEIRTCIVVSPAAGVAGGDVVGMSPQELAGHSNELHAPGRAP